MIIKLDLPEIQGSGIVLQKAEPMWINTNQIVRIEPDKSPFGKAYLHFSNGMGCFVSESADEIANMNNA